MCENLLCPDIFKEALSQVLTEKFKVPSHYYLTSQALCMIPILKTIGLVVDCGYEETRVLPVYDGIPLTHAVSLAPIGSRVVLENLLSLLSKNCKIQNSVTGKEEAINEKSLGPSALDDIMVRLLYVESPDVKATDAKNFDYRIDEQHSIKIPSIIRSLSTEVLFEGDDEEVSVASMILDSLKK